MRSLFILLLTLSASRSVWADCTAEHKRAGALRETLAAVGQTTPEYRSMMVKKIQEAETAAANCERAAADAKRADELKAAERKREMEAEAKKEAEERFAIDEMRSQIDFLRIAWSAYECKFEKDRDDVLNNPFATAEQKEALKRAEAMLTRIRATMKHGKVTQLSCRLNDVAKLAFCIANGNANAACSESAMALRARAQKEIVAAVQLAPNPAPLSPAQQHATAEEDDQKILQPNF